MTEADFLDYEPSRVRLIDLSEATRKLALHADPLIMMRRRSRPIGHAARRLRDGHGIGLVMLCTLGQMHGEWILGHCDFDAATARVLMQGRRKGMSVEAIRELPR